MTLTIQEDLTVDSRVIAEHCEIEHEAAIRLLTTYQAEIEAELEPIRFQIGLGKPGRGGKAPKFALLTEDQATALITLMRNTKPVVRFKVALTKAFSRAKQMLAERQGAPTWKQNRVDAATAFRVQARAISDFRLSCGKDVKPHHFMCEAKLINWVLKGQFQGIDRNSLTSFDLSALRELQVANTYYIMKGWDYDRRKAELPNDLAAFKAKTQAKLTVKEAGAR
jgi:phage regulator Rha-like protein